MILEKIGPLDAPISHCLSPRIPVPGGPAMADRVLDERSIFLRAVEITAAGERSSFLDAACGADRQLRRQVEALLLAHEGSFGLLDAPDRASPTIDRPSISEDPGTAVGLYKLMEQIGEGGMGVVYVAEQHQPV